jgi:hypothetical protein
MIPDPLPLRCVLGHLKPSNTPGTVCVTCNRAVSRAQSILVKHAKEAVGMTYHEYRDYHGTSISAASDVLVDALQDPGDILRFALTDDEQAILLAKKGIAGRWLREPPLDFSSES